MTLQQLRDLIEVVAHGGFRAAARALDVSQAGLTKSLANLEEEYGLSILERTAKGVVLTARGEEFVAYARSVLIEAERAEQWLRSATGIKSSKLAIGLSIEPSLRLAPSVLGDFRRAFPEVTVHVTQRSATELLAALRDNRLEVAVMRLPREIDANDLRIDPLYDAAATIVARKGHPMLRAVSVTELADTEWIVVGDPNLPGQHDNSIQELFVRHKLGSPRFAAVSDSLFGAVAMLLETDCVARLPTGILEHPLTANALTEIRVKEQLSLAFEIAVVFRASRRLTREAAQLVAMLKSFARLQRALGAESWAAAPTGGSCRRR
jgi:DNA-binding transcriptional LysR family regulator